MPNYQKRIVYLSDAQRQELFTNGTITVNGQTITYDANDMYVTPQEEPYIKPTNGIPASDLDPSVLNSKADKNNTVITTSLSMYRKADTTVGGASTAIGGYNTASGNYSTAFGNTTTASGTSSFTAGTNTEASGMNSVAEGNYANADGRSAHAAGEYTRANGRANFVRGRANVLNTTTIFPEWAANTDYSQYDRVKVTTESNGETTVTLHMCTTDHTSTSTFDSSKWEDVTDYKDFVDIVGNGRNGTDRSNAYALDWNGNAYFKGNVYAGCNDDSTGGSVLPRDVQVNGTSVVTNGVANVPIAGANLGLVRNHPAGLGVGILPDTGYPYVQGANVLEIKSGTTDYRVIVVSHQHESAFYGLAKAAGDTTQSASSNAVGTYTDEAKTAIRSMLGVVGDVQVNGTSVTSNGVANIPVAIENQEGFGVVHIYSGFGIKSLDGTLRINYAEMIDTKIGTGYYAPITPRTQHASAFYGLAKAAGDITQSQSSNAVGTYTDNAKASIKSMLGVVDGSTGTVDITGTTPTITAVENTRYVCGEVSTLTFTPPSSGITIVRFTSGTTPAVLTVPNTVIFPEWFDASDLEASRIYEICITDGAYGAVMSWPL